MRKLKFLGFILILFTLFSLASCSDDDVKSFDSSKLEGIWTQVFDSRIQDASVVKYVFYPETSSSVVKYVFYPETSYSGRIELYKSNWPDEGWTVTDLHYRVGETAHMNIFTGKEHDGKTKIYIECGIRKLTKTEMVWYKTDSKEEMARFKKDSKIDNN